MDTPFTEGEIHPIEEYVRLRNAGEKDWIEHWVDAGVFDIEAYLAKYAKLDELYGT